MPVVAIAGAVLAGVGAASAVSAVAAGGLAALTLTGALEITAAIGATLGAVGTITRDKGLMTAGLVIGGIGGIGALAANAGLLGAEASTASLFGESSAAGAISEIPDAIDVTPQIFGTNVGGAGADALSGGTGTGIVDTLSNTGAAKAATAAAAEPQAASGAGMINTNAAGAALPEAGTDVVKSAASMPKEVQTSILSPWGADAPPAPFVQDVATSSAPAAPSVEAPGMLGRLSAFAEKNPVVSYGMIQAGGSLVSGLFNPVTPAQVAALDAQAAANRANTGLTENQLKNVAQPLPVARRTTPGNGMINTAVTGTA